MHTLEKFFDRLINGGTIRNFRNIDCQFTGIRQAASGLFHPALDIAAGLIRLCPGIPFTGHSATEQCANLFLHEHEFTRARIAKDRFDETVSSNTCCLMSWRKLGPMSGELLITVSPTSGWLK